MRLPAILLVASSLMLTAFAPPPSTAPDLPPTIAAFQRLCLATDGVPERVFAGARDPDTEGASSFFEDDGATHRILGPEAKDARQKALAAGTLRLIKAEPLRPQGVAIIYGVARLDDTARPAPPQ